LWADFYFFLFFLQTFNPVLVLGLIFSDLVLFSSPQHHYPITMSKYYTFTARRNSQVQGLIIMTKFQKNYKQHHVVSHSQSTPSKANIIQSNPSVL